MTSFYSLQAALNDETLLSMGKFRGKKLMIVNTASECGFTPQYTLLQELYEHFSPSGFEVVAFPSPDFGGQEPGSDHDILDFCTRNYGVTFTIMKKSHVAGKEANAVFRWLADKGANGVMEAVPEWNFAKFLVDENGRLFRQLPASESPVCDEVIDWLSKEKI